MNSVSRAWRYSQVIGMAVLALASGAASLQAQPASDFVPVTDAMLQAPAPRTG